MNLDNPKKKNFTRRNLAQERLERLREELSLKRKNEANKRLTKPRSKNSDVARCKIVHAIKSSEGSSTLCNNKKWSTESGSTNIANESHGLLQSRFASNKDSCPSNDIFIYGNNNRTPVHNKKKRVPVKYLKEKQGILSKRLEKVRSAALKNVSKTNNVMNKNGKKMLNNGRFHEENLKIPNNVSNSLHLPVVKSSLEINSLSNNPKKPNDEQLSLTEKELPYKTNSLDNNEIFYENTCMDVDMEDAPSCTDIKLANSSTSKEVDWKWQDNSKTDVSFFNQEIQRIRKDSAYLAHHESYINDVEMSLAVPIGDLLIVVDTNIFLSHLRFLNHLLKSNVASYKSHTLVVPWLVIQEIDYAMKRRDEKLSTQAKKANFFVFECLKKNHARFFGQSFDDFKAYFKNAVSIDDFLLEYCLKLVSLQNNVVLLSDDKNLCNKCMVSNVPVYTKEEFEKTFDILNLD